MPEPVDVLHEEQAEVEAGLKIKLVDLILIALNSQQGDFFFCFGQLLFGRLIVQYTALGKVDNLLLLVLGFLDLFIKQHDILANLALLFLPCVHNNRSEKSCVAGFGGQLLQKLHKLRLKDDFCDVRRMTLGAVVVGILPAIASRPTAGKLATTLGASRRNAEWKVRIKHPFGVARVIGVRSEIKLDFVEKLDGDDRLKSALYLLAFVIKASGVEFGAEDFVDCLLADRFIASFRVQTPRMRHARQLAHFVNSFGVLFKKTFDKRRDYGIGFNCFLAIGFENVLVSS